MRRAWILTLLPALIGAAAVLARDQTFPMGLVDSAFRLTLRDGESRTQHLKIRR